MKQEKTKITILAYAFLSCKCKRWLDWCVPVVWRASRMEEKGYRRKKDARREERERRENGWMVVEALSTGSLGHSYASAVGTITAKPRLLHKMLHIRSNTNIGIDTCESANQLFDDMQDWRVDIKM